MLVELSVVEQRYLAVREAPGDCTRWWWWWDGSNPPPEWYEQHPVNQGR